MGGFQVDFEHIKTGLSSARDVIVESQKKHTEAVDSLRKAIAIHFRSRQGDALFEQLQRQETVITAQKRQIQLLREAIQRETMGREFHQSLRLLKNDWEAEKARGRNIAASLRLIKAHLGAFGDTLADASRKAIGLSGILVRSKQKESCRECETQKMRSMRALVERSQMQLETERARFFNLETLRAQQLRLQDFANGLAGFEQQVLFKTGHLREITVRLDVLEARLGAVPGSWQHGISIKKSRAAISQTAQGLALVFEGQQQQTTSKLKKLSKTVTSLEKIVEERLPAAIHSAASYLPSVKKELETLRDSCVQQASDVEKKIISALAKIQTTVSPAITAAKTVGDLMHSQTDFSTFGEHIVEKFGALSLRMQQIEDILVQVAAAQQAQKELLEQSYEGEEQAEETTEEETEEHKEGGTA